MVAVRRWYVFLVCAVSLQSVAWAAIALLRDLIIQPGRAPVTALAFQIAVIVIGLPVYLGHWLWAQRLAARDPDERASALRRLYLYGMLAGFLGPFIANAYHLAAWFLETPLGVRQPGVLTRELATGESAARSVAAMGALALLWLYHERIVRADARAVPESGAAGGVRRLYVLGFSAAGLTLTAVAVTDILRWMLYRLFEGGALGLLGTARLADDVARLAVGLPLWLVFWRLAQRAFAAPQEEERESVLRKLYLYLIVFTAVLGAVAQATIVLAGMFRRLLGLAPRGDLREALPIIVVMAVLWAYHAGVLRGDAAVAGEAPRQAGVRRLYLYLVAAIGLAAFLIGLGGVISVIIRALAAEATGELLSEQVAVFGAALCAGLPVWLLPWRATQGGALRADACGADERRSVVRKIYLYFYLFAAAMTVLSGAVYILTRLLSVALGEPGRGSLLADLGQAIAFTLIGAAVWLYHGAALRGDRDTARREQAQRLAGWRVAVVDGGEGRFGRAVLEGLRRELAGLDLVPIALTEGAGQAMQAPVAEAATRLKGARLIVGPWLMARPGGEVSEAFAQAVAASSARRLLAPLWVEGWDWAGVERESPEALARQAVRAVRQAVAGERIHATRSLGVGAIIALVIGGLLLLQLLVPLLGLLLGNLF